METLVKPKMRRPLITNASRGSITTPGDQMHQLIKEMYPVCRSITGDGVRQTLEILKSIIPIETYEIPSGTKVFDWEVPREWNIRDACILNPAGEKILNFKDSNLHVLNYSIPVHKKVTLRELKQHIHTSPEHPDWIPYRTSYYREEWGFCMTHKQFQELEDGVYEVFIDSSLHQGSLTFGEFYIPGEHPDEVLISAHICHPSLCNDNLSGISLAAFLAKNLKDRKLRYSYRFLFIPGTIGAITWLCVNEPKVKNIKHGLVAALLGNESDFIYKKSRTGNAEIDQVVEMVLAHSGHPYKVINFSPYGYDERQYCSPGFNLHVGSLTRARNDQYPEYHTSADNLEFVKPRALEASLQMYNEVIDTLEGNHKYRTLNPKCEPQLGKRGLYNVEDNEDGNFQFALLWVLNLSDGYHTLLDICKQSGMSFDLIFRAAEKLVECKLLIKKSDIVS